MTQLAKEAAKSWSSTLRLPKSTFPPRATSEDLSKYLKRSTDDLYTWQSEARAERRPFILHDGPPYANGDLHVGHALNKILKDIINRTKLQQGARINYVPGWDCHGLPIEQKAFEHHGWSVGNKPDAVQVRKAATAFANDAVEKQMVGFRSWGVMGAWDQHWKTMDKEFELRQLKIFRDMAKHGLIYRRHKPVYWSPSSRTALAEAELEYNEEHVSRAALLKFLLNSASNFGGGEPVSLIIWTTTPWTLPANQAIAINRGLDYVVVDSAKHGKLLVARSRLQAVEAMLSETLPVSKVVVDVNELLQSSYRGLATFDDTVRPIIHADFVSAEAGTGLVHCAPGHGMEDYEALQQQIRSGRIRVKAPVDDEGNFTSEASLTEPELLLGKSVFGEGNATVIATLARAGSLLTVHDYKHKYPYDWRTKQPILIRATAQWFADLADIKSDALGALDAVDFQPKTGQFRLRSFVQNRSEWCISRQRSWGVPIPALYDKDSGEAVLSNQSISHIIDVIDQRGTDAWWSDAADDTAWITPGLDPGQYIRSTDTMDVWFDSGTSWSGIQLKEEDESDLAHVYLEGTDQHRGWFQSSLLTCVATQKARHPELTATAPFRQLITHGFTLDGAGKKMSKSIGNVISPEQIITGEFEFASKAVLNSIRTADTKTLRKTSAPKNGRRSAGSLGPDALRLWVASSDWSKDVVVSDTIVKTIHASLHKYRVTFKLLLGALENFAPNDLLTLPTSQLNKVDRLALLQLHEVGTEVRRAFDNLEFHKAVSTINKWVNTDLSGFYIEAIKDTLYCDGVNNDRRRGAQIMLCRILKQMQAILAPLTPMLVQESWEHSPECIRINEALPPLQRIWSGPPPEYHDEHLKKIYLPLVMAINTACKAAQERARMEKWMGSSLESECLVHVPGYLNIATLSSTDSADTIRELENDLQEILVVSYIKAFDAGAESLLTPYTFEDFSKRMDDSSVYASREWQARIHSLDQPWSHVEEFTMPDGKTKGFVMVYPPVNAKCQRCWRYDVEVKGNIDAVQDLHEPQEELCKRCQAVITSLSSAENAPKKGA